MKLRNINRSDIFSKGLFREGMLQLRAIGIAFICLCSLCGIYDFIDYYPGDPLYAQSPGAMIMLAFYAVAPVMYLTIFRFLNSRSASDFYHAIPRSRLSLAISFSAAVGAWIGIALLCNFLLNILGALCVVNYSVVSDFAAWGSAVLGCIALFVQVTGIVLIGVSIANNLVNQVTIIALIAFLPRALLIYFSNLIEDFAPVLFGLSDTLGIFADNDINLLCGGLFSNNGYALTSCAYSFVLGIIYAVIGLVLFCRRRSETATQSAVNKTVQTVIRVAVAFVLCMIPAGELAEQVFDPRSHYDFFDDGGFIIYGLAIIAYFLYEAVSTRRLKGLFKLTPDMVIGFIALVALNLAIIFGVPFAANVALDRPLNVDTVKSVSIYTPYSSTPTYENLMASQVEFEDPAVIKSMCDALAGNVEAIRSGAGNSFNYRYDDKYTTAYTVRMKLRNGGYVKRIIYMIPSDTAELNTNMEASNEYLVSMRAFPEWKQCNVEISSLADNKDKEIYHDIYKALKSELDMMSDEDYYRYITEDFDSFDCPVLEHVRLSGTYNGQEWKSSYPICSMVPKTANLYMSAANKAAPIPLDELWEKCRTADSAKDDSFYDFQFDIIPYNMEAVYGDGFLEFDYHYITADYTSYDEKVMERIADSADKPVDCLKPFIVVSAYYVTENYNYNNCIYYISAEDFIVPQEEISSADLHVSLDEMLGD